MTKMISFIDYSSNILADTDNGISTSQVLSICNKFAAEYNVSIPHTRINTGCAQTYPNKRTALKENLQRFSSEQAFNIIKYICELNKFCDNAEFKKVKIQLYKDFPAYIKTDVSHDLDESILKVKGILSDYPNIEKFYNDAISQFNAEIYERNTIDNLRLCLELLLKKILSNEKSLENNIDLTCKYMKDKNCSQEFIHMIRQLIDYYAKFNNNNIKHNIKINKNEIKFVFGLTNLFIQLLEE